MNQLNTLSTHPLSVIIEECDAHLPVLVPPFSDYNLISSLVNDPLEFRTFLDVRTLGHLISCVRKYSDTEAFKNTKECISSQGVYKHSMDENHTFLWHPRDDYYVQIGLLATNYILATEEFPLHTQLLSVIKHPNYTKVVAELFYIDTELRIKRATQGPIQQLHGTKIALLVDENDERYAFDMTYSDDPAATDLETLPRPHYSCLYCNALPTLTERLSKCSRCKIAYYCKQECQLADWKSHKATCVNVQNK
jgi:hypothetical protein